MEVSIDTIQRLVESADYTVTVTPITGGVVAGRLVNEGRTRHESVGASPVEVLVELAHKAGLRWVHWDSQRQGAFVTLLEEPDPPVASGRAPA